MPEGEKFVEQAKAQLLYEHRQGNDIEQMLDQSETNSRVNSALVVVCLLVGYARHAWRGKYKGLLADLDIVLQRMYLNYDGFSREQAIRMSGMKSMPVMEGGEGVKKKGGLLGVLGK